MEYNAASGGVEFTFPEKGETRTLTVIANGGTVTVEAWTGAQWCSDPDLVFSANVVREITISQSKIRITATGSAVFGFEGP